MDCVERKVDSNFEWCVWCDDHETPKKNNTDIEEKKLFFFFDEFSSRLTHSQKAYGW